MFHGQVDHSSHPLPSGGLPLVDAPSHQEKITGHDDQLRGSNGQEGPTRTEEQ